MPFLDFFDWLNFFYGTLGFWFLKIIFQKYLYNNPSLCHLLVL